MSRSGGSNYGSFIAAVQQEQKDTRKKRGDALAGGNREDYQRAVARAEELGFSVGEASLVASAVRTRGPATRNELRAHLAATYPWLDENDDKGGC